MHVAFTRYTTEEVEGESESVSLTFGQKVGA